MDAEMRKRLEEAAENFRGCFLGRMNKCRELKGKKPYSADNEIMDICLDAAKIGYKEGAEHGYKEAIVQATEWLKELIENNRYEYLDDDMIVYFKSYMNKLWEGEK